MDIVLTLLPDSAFLEINKDQVVIYQERISYGIFVVREADDGSADEMNASR